MADAIRVLFVDTNIFLQVRDLKDLPWGDLFPGVMAIDVMVAPRVIEELDAHKTSTRSRVRDRARAALRQIDQASSQPDFALVLRDRPFRLSLVISRAPRFDWSAHTVLDPAKPDDQLVAEALSFGNGAEVLAHDSGPRIRARIANLQAYAPPVDWLLPVEQTDEQRQIKKLERDLEQALSVRPKIIANFDNIDALTSELRLIMPVVLPLDQRRANSCAREYINKHQRLSLRGSHVGFPWNPHLVPVGEIERYETEYSHFEHEVFDYFRSLHDFVARRGKIVAVGYRVENASSIAAEGLRIQFDLEGDASLLATREDTKGYSEKSEIPLPPKKPRSEMDAFSSLSINSFREASQPRDPIAFYWIDRPAFGAKHCAIQCQEFRATQVYQDDIFVQSASDMPLTLDIHLNVSAKNLAAPVDVPAKLLVFEQQVEWSHPSVQAILPDEVRKLLS